MEGVFAENPKKRRSLTQNSPEQRRQAIRDCLQQVKTCIENVNRLLKEEAAHDPVVIVIDD